jgi:hypothetical protein
MAPPTYRRTMPDEAWGITELALITAGVILTLWTIAHLADVLERGDRVARFLKIVKSPAPAPAGMPIERIAADLRRIRPQALLPTTGMPMARRRAIVAAYDEALLDACRALDVPTDLDRLTDALERESERLRTEAELARAGVAFEGRA